VAPKKQQKDIVTFLNLTPPSFFLGVEQLIVPQMGLERESEGKKERECNKPPAHTLTQGERESAN